MYYFPRFARSGAALLACLIATNASAELTIASQAPQNSAIMSVQVVQAQGDVLSDSDLRRINHYSAQAMEALSDLEKLDTENSVGLDAGIAVLRNRLMRLIDAGQRSGLSRDLTASYFGSYLEANHFADIPEFMKNALGRLDTVALLKSTEQFFANQERQVVDAAAYDAQDLQSIREVAIGATPPPSDAGAAALLNTAPEPERPLSRPLVPAGADEATRLIFQRIELREGQWFITVERGDSLGQFAAAIYGDSLQFRRIYDANTAVIETPNILEIGVTLVLPQP